MGFAKIKGTGWMKDYPDFRDNTPKTDELSPKQKLRGVTKSVSKILEKVNGPAGKKTASAKKAFACFKS